MTDRIAANATQAAVAAVVNAPTTVNGDTVLIPNGSATWTSGISTTKQIIIRAQNYTPTPAGTAGAPNYTNRGGATTRNVTITNGSNSGALFSFTSGNSFHCGVGGIRINEGTGHTQAIVINGSGSKVPLIFDMYFQALLRRSGDGYDRLIEVHGRGGLMWNCVFEASNMNLNDVGDGAMWVKPDNGIRDWTTASTMGNLDTTGDWNFYIEDCSMKDCALFPDTDDHGRVVIRNSFYDSAWAETHGFTSLWGGRHWECYGNRFTQTTQGKNISARYFWCRAGTGIFTDNRVDKEVNPSDHGGQESQLDIGDNTAPGSPIPGSNPPLIARQPGCGHNGTTYVRDPIYIWNQTGVCGANWGTNNQSGNWGAVVLLNRDIFVSGAAQQANYLTAPGAKPGYVKFTYPHPFRTVVENGGPPPPTGTYYVDNTAGNDANNGTSPATAWQRCPGMTGYTGSGTLVPGDTVLFDRGDTWLVGAGNQCLWLVGGVTYDGETHGTGTRATIRATGEQQTGVIRFRDHATLPTIIKGFNLDGNNQVTSGVDINHAFGSLMNGATKRVQNCEVHHTFSRTSLGQFKYGIIASNHGGTSTLCANVEIIDCLVHDVSRDGIVLYPGDENAQCNLSNCLVRGCEVHTTSTDPDYDGGSGIAVKGFVTNAVIEYNYVHDTVAASLFLNGNESNTFGNLVGPVTARHNIFTNNTAHGAIRLFQGTATGDPMSLDCYSNLVYNSTANGGLLIDGDYKNQLTLRFYNNTLFNAPVIIRPGGGITVVLLEVRNNLMHYTGGTPLTDQSQRITLHSNNTYFRASGGTLVQNGGTAVTAATLAAYEATGVSTDPLLVNPAQLPTGFTGTFGVNKAPNQPGLSLQASSPAINSGAALAALYNSAINTQTRPLQSAWDRGAYEIAGSGTPPAAPTNLRVA